MKILLDSHIMLWALCEDPSLPESAKAYINDPENTIFYSPISIYELELKRMNHKNEIRFSGQEIADACDKSGFLMLPIINSHVCELSTLQKPDSCDHKDPFDRLLLCQAKSENMFLLTHDSKIKQYNEQCILGV